MKAKVNYNLEGDEEPDVLGRAQNPKSTFFWEGCQIPGLQLPCFKTSVFTTAGFCHIGAPDALQEVNIGHLRSHHVNYTTI